MFKSLVFVATTATIGLLFSLGCEKKSADPIAELTKAIPKTAPKTSTAPGTVFEHLQYAMVRKVPKHLELFLPEDELRAFGAIRDFHFNAGWYGLGLTPEEIAAIGVQDMVQKGFISDKWTYKHIKEAMDGKREAEPGMERYANSLQFDMPHLTVPPLEKKLFDTLWAERKAAMQSNMKGAYASGLYRLLKAIPEDGWPLITATVGSNPDKALNDLILKFGDIQIATIVVGKNSDGAMFIWGVLFTDNRSPAALNRLFNPSPSQEASN